MSRDITRRDILDGVALTIAASLLPGGAAAAPGQPVPPARTGLRGSHDGAFEVAHSLAFGERSFAIDGLPVEELHDLVVVGAGISGLAAAHYYRRRFGRQARVLVLDNHDDVGGHATRNEFKVGGRTLLSYGGSESLQSPTSFSATVNALMGELGVEIDRFETYFDRRLYADLGLQRATFFDAATFGTDRLVAGDPTVWVSDDTVPGRRPERPIRDFVADFPMSEEARAQLLAIHTEPRSILPDLAPPARERALKRVSYPDFLRTHWGAGEEALRFFAQRTHDYFGLPAAFVTAEEAWQAGYPGFQGIADGPAHPGGEPYIHHFPDGNASIARLLVRRLVPRALQGSTMEDVVLARLRYDRLDEPDRPVRIRLSSTVVQARNRRGGVDIGYVRQGRLRRVRARHVVMAGWNMMIPHVVPETPEPQRAALRNNVKMPLVYAKVAIADWRAAARLKVHDIYAPGAFFARTKLDFPVSMGGYRCPRDPSEPMVLHMVHVPTTAEGFSDARDALRAGRGRLLGMPFAAFEGEIRGQLDRMLGPGGFESGRDIRAITVNRWSHGYSGSPATLGGDPDDGDAEIAAAAKPIGRIAVANADRAWSAYLHSAIDAAHAAVGELPA